MAEWRDRREAGNTPCERDELRAMMAEGLANGPSHLASMVEVKAEARARLASRRRD